MPGFEYKILNGVLSANVATNYGFSYVDSVGPVSITYEDYDVQIVNGVTFKTPVTRTEQFANWTTAATKIGVLFVVPANRVYDGTMLNADPSIAQNPAINFRNAFIAQMRAVFDDRMACIQYKGMSSGAKAQLSPYNSYIDNNLI